MAMQDDLPTTTFAREEMFQSGEPRDKDPMGHLGFESADFPHDAVARQRMLAAIVGRESLIGYS